MNPIKENRKIESSPSRVACVEPWPIATIRTETVLSRLPIHNLAKKGNINIQIVKRNAEGAITLHWEVSHSDRYGQPRQIAYKLDTLVINRRIDEQGRPLPKLICLGSLREIAAELGLARNTNQVRRALRQNAFAAITAKLSYRTTDGRERTLEADFTRYGVIFTGEKLPDGRRADAVYITLNEPYRDVLNNVPVRPLNYEYLKVLTPAAQRFYEILSYRVFAALKSGTHEARIAYSEYCTFSAQQRYFDHDHFKKQMYKIHRAHLRSGYLSEVSHVSATDADGKPDWMMCYVPGPRAEAEFRTFASTRSKRSLASRNSAVIQTGEWSGRDHSRIAQRLARPLPDAIELVQYFHRRVRGIENYELPPRSKEGMQADEILAAHGKDAARFVVEYAAQQAERTKFSMRVFGAIAQYIPEGIAAYQRRNRVADANRRREHAIEEEKRQAEVVYQRGKAALGALPAAARTALHDEIKAEYQAKYPRVGESQFVERMIERAMIARLARPDSTGQAGLAA